jgi:hypothetical protein
MSKISNNESWNNIFDRYNLINKINKNGFVNITSDQIKALDGKEARNMAKIDFREKLPSIMKNNNLSILAINNGIYKIARNDPFIDIKKEISTNIIEIDPPRDIMGIDPYSIRSESSALDISAISGMHDIVFGEKTQLTIRGRLRGSLKFNINDIFYDVNGVQIEVDGGYESKSNIHLIEAKIGFNSNINIRQLLYPKLYWQSYINNKKIVKSYILYFYDDLYRFIPYYYDGIVGYVDHLEEKVFRFRPQLVDFSLNSIQINESNIDNSVPFPQADNFQVINTMLILINQSSCISKAELKSRFDIVDRQIDYYFNVLKWLKLSKEEKDCLVLTPKAKIILQKRFKERIKELAIIVFSHRITNAILNNKDIDFKLFELYNIKSQSTVNRRIQTINSWLKYFKSILE